MLLIQKADNVSEPSSLPVPPEQGDDRAETHVDCRSRCFVESFAGRLIPEQEEADANAHDGER